MKKIRLGGILNNEKNIYDINKFEKIINETSSFFKDIFNKIINDNNYELFNCIYDIDDIYANNVYIDLKFLNLKYKNKYTVKDIKYVNLTYSNYITITNTNSLGMNQSNGDAAVIKFTFDGKKVGERWYSNGLLSREDGPALIEYDEDKNILIEDYYLNGKQLSELQIMVNISCESEG